MTPSYYVLQDTYKNSFTASHLRHSSKNLSMTTVNGTGSYAATPMKHS